MNNMSEPVSIVEPMRFVFDSEKVGDNLTITTISIQGEPVFMYPVETENVEEAERITQNAFLLMLRDNYQRNVKRALREKAYLQKTDDNFFDELI
jgi:hypothetical protein